MKRRFSVVETVRIEYEYITTDEQDALIDKYHGSSFRRYIEDVGVSSLWEGQNVPEHNQILDYLNTDYETFCEE